MSDGKKYRFGFVSVVGGTNVGKSTLVNALVGRKICATSPKPNTTRNRINGIFTDNEAQIVFTDTPGIVRPRGELLKKMTASALGALESGITLAVTDNSAPFGAGEVKVIKDSSRPVIVALNKTDIGGRKSVLEALKKSERFGDKIADIVPVSALKKTGLERLLEVLKKSLPEGEKQFPDDNGTDAMEEFIAAEFVREKIFRLTHGEVPYQSAVAVREMRRGKGKILYINAEVFLEKESHKKIVIGKGGKMLKEIGSRARSDIEKFLGTKIFLELNVMAKPGWSKDRDFIEDIYGR
ncbi:GTPase Era [Candidatus Mycalebacterium sp.]